MKITPTLKSASQATWVAKVGGSLLEAPDFPELRERLQAMLDRHGGQRPLLVVGGGSTVDCIRRWEALYQLGEEFSHWLAVRALSITARVVEKILRNALVAENVAACETVWQSRRVPILDCLDFLQAIDGGRVDPLPRSWSVTSDSIAARVAEYFQAPELALLKSSTIPHPIRRQEAAKRGFVDPHFPMASRNLPRCIVYNLRQEAPSASWLIE